MVFSHSDRRRMLRRTESHLLTERLNCGILTLKVSGAIPSCYAYVLNIAERIDL